MCKILAEVTANFKAKAAPKSVRWIGLTAVLALALGFGAPPLDITDGHVNLNQAKASPNGKDEGGGDKGGGDKGGGDKGGGDKGGGDKGGGDKGEGGGDKGEGGLSAGGGRPGGPSASGGGVGGNPGGGPEGGLENGDSAESRGNDKGGVNSSQDAPSVQRPNISAVGRRNTRPGGGNNTGNAPGRGNPPILRENDVVSGSGKGFQAGPAQGRGANELTSPLFSAPSSIPAKGKDQAPPAASSPKADNTGKMAPAARTDAAITTSIQQRIGDQSGPDLDSSAEAALIERGWKR